MKRNIGTYVPALSIFSLSFLIFIAGSVTQVTDSNYSMMVSQSILDHGTVRLDQYKIPRLNPRAEPGILDSGYPYQIEDHNGHLYYFFPPGTSILSVPFVGMLNILGISTVHADGSYDQGGEVRIERVTSAILMAFLSAIFYYTGRLLLSVKTSVLLAIVGALGTPVLSTASRAMWSHTWLILLLGIALFLVVRAFRDKCAPNPILLATLLAWMYFVRPTASISIVSISALVFIYWRSVLLRFVLTGMAWFGAFVSYSLYNFGQILPSYYSTGRLGSKTFSEALVGNMFSPARGLIIYSPFILIVLYMLWRNRKRIPYKAVVWAALIAVMLHWIAVSEFPHWWAGHSYGPRFMTDITPWIMTICTLAVAPMSRVSVEEESAASNKIGHAIMPKWLRWLSVVLVTISICMHMRGAYSKDTFLWNVYPSNIDWHRSRLWDWSYPQFLAGIVRAQMDNVAVPEYKLGTRIWLNSGSSQPYLISGWSQAEPNFRWTDGGQAVLGFRINEVRPLEISMKLAPFVVDNALDWQRVKIRFNGKFVAEIRIGQQPMGLLQLTIPASIVRQHNIVKFDLPDAESPKKLHVNDDERKLALAVQWIEISAI